MTYLTFEFFFMVAFAMVVYYLVPGKRRWIVLLMASVYFYIRAVQDWKVLLVFGATIVVSFIFTDLIFQSVHRPARKHNKKSRSSLVILWIGIILSALPLFATKANTFISASVLHREPLNLVVPLGLSFYTLQIIAYLVDIYRGKIKPERNFFRYALFISFFPQIIQGPIPRYEQLSEQLFKNVRSTPKYDNFIGGFQKILWGFFLKLMIANKAGLYVDGFFTQPGAYGGAYSWLAGILYSIQLYTDFQSCVMISQGVSQCFGITLVDNFSRPYFSQSVQEFWRRWHESLSFWLRDYVYIPLGGNRKGRIRKYMNIFITFVVSGLWHGNGFRFLFWGMLHGIYQIAGSINKKFTEAVYRFMNLPELLERIVRMVLTFFFVMIGWIIFRAPSLHTGISVVASLFRFNPWVLTNGGIYGLGLDRNNFAVLNISILVLIIAGILQEKNINIGEKFRSWSMSGRFVLYFIAIISICVFGTYGFGFDAKDFIYGGF